MTFARFFYDDTKYKHYQRYLLDSLNSRKSEKMINCLIFTSHKLMKLLQPDWQITFFCFCFYQRKLKKPVFIIPVLMIQQFSCKFSFCLSFLITLKITFNYVTLKMVLLRDVCYYFDVCFFLHLIFGFFGITQSSFAQFLIYEFCSLLQ